MGGLTKDLGIMSNTQMTIAFWLNVENTFRGWRNVFLMGNHGATDDSTRAGFRIPLLQIYPKEEWFNSYYTNCANLHFRFGTINNHNDGLKPGGNGPLEYDPDLRFPFGQDIHITFTIAGKTIKYYQNGVEKFSRTLNNNERFVNNNSTTRLYMSPSNDIQHTSGVKLKNFQIFNRPLNGGEVMEVYNQIVCKY